VTDYFERFEFKYAVQSERREALRDRLLTHMEYDPFCDVHPEKMYSVHSIYLDTSRYLFYFEKLDSIKVRKKLRVRVYEQSEANKTVFLEIKRKINNNVLKERVRVPFEELQSLMSSEEIHPTDRERPRSRLALDHFTFLTRRLALEPKILISYEREAFHGIDSSDVRITFDMNIRSFPTSTFEYLKRPVETRNVSGRFFIMEVKFHGALPAWVNRIISDFGFHLQSYSKYCEGLDVWMATDRMARSAS